MALTTHPHLAPRLKEEESHTSTPSLGLHGLFYGDFYDFAKYETETRDGPVYQLISTLVFSC